MLRIEDILTRITLKYYIVLVCVPLQLLNQWTDLTKFGVTFKPLVATRTPFSLIS